MEPAAIYKLNRGGLSRVKKKNVSQRPAKATVREEEHSNDGMMTEERCMQILQIVRSEGRAKVNDLVRRFNTSALTIRSDLNELDQRGFVQRSHGGAVIQDTVFRESPVQERIKSQSKGEATDCRHGCHAYSGRRDDHLGFRHDHA